MMLDYILLEVVMYSANNLQVTSELVLASLSSFLVKLLSNSQQIYLQSEGKVTPC